MTDPIQGKRAMGVDRAAGNDFGVEVESIAWQDGTFTIASVRKVRRHNHPTRLDDDTEIRIVGCPGCIDEERQ